MEDKDRDSFLLDLPMSSRHYSSPICESSIVTNLPSSQVLVTPFESILVTPFESILVTKPVFEPSAPILNESELCASLVVRVMAKEKQRQSSTHPLQV